MSIASDLRSYADTAVSQGKQVTDKATGAVKDLRASAEKALNVDAIKTAVEPYVAQAKDYTHTVTDKAEALYVQVRSDKRVAKLVDAAEPVLGVVVGTVQERVVKPVQTLTGRGSKPAPKAAKPAPAKPAASKPAPAKPAARKAPAKRTTS